MKIKDVMTRAVWSSTPDAPLSEVARIMWDKDCGFVPLMDPETQALRGVVTDRDVCMAAWTSGRHLTEIPAGEVMVRDVQSCHEDDEVSAIHEGMRRHQVRRMPVVDAADRPIGVVSLNDLAIAAHDGRAQRDVAMTLSAVCRHRAAAAAAVTP